MNFASGAAVRGARAIAAAGILAALAACTLPSRAPERDWLPGFEASAIAGPEAARAALQAAGDRRSGNEPVTSASW